MPEYSHPCHAKKFTQHQLFACLVLKEFFKLDYRGVEALLVDSDSLRAIIDLRVPHGFTTLHKACRRLLRLPVCNQLLDETIAVAKRTPLLQSPVKVAAIDSSGFEAHQASNYFVRRRAPYGKQTGKWQETTYRRFPKLGVVCDCRSHLILAAVPERGPKPDDGHWSRAMAEARRRVRMKLLLCDAGLRRRVDSLWGLRGWRFRPRTIIPPTRGRPTKKLPRQYYRRQVARLFKRRVSEGPTDKTLPGRNRVQAWSNTPRRRLRKRLAATGAGAVRHTEESDHSQYHSDPQTKTGFRQSRSPRLIIVRRPVRCVAIRRQCRVLKDARHAHKGQSSTDRAGRRIRSVEHPDFLAEQFVLFGTHMAMVHELQYGQKHTDQGRFVHSGAEQLAELQAAGSANWALILSMCTCIGVSS